MSMLMSSRRALLLSLRTLLKVPLEAAVPGLGLTEANCSLTSSGRPPVASGQWFYGLHGQGGKYSAKTSYIELPSLAVTISARINVPADRIGTGLIDAEDGMDDRMGALRAWLARYQHNWMNAASDLLGASYQAFTLPVFDMQESPIREVGPEWWLAPAASAGLKTTPAMPGLTATLTMSGFKREQYIESAT